MPTIDVVCGAKRAILSRLEIGSELCFVGVAENSNRSVSIRFWRLGAPPSLLEDETAGVGRRVVVG
jgi:hypothetical protein